MRVGILVVIVLIIRVLAGFGGGYLLSPTITATKNSDVYHHFAYDCYRGLAHHSLQDGDYY